MSKNSGLEDLRLKEKRDNEPKTIKHEEDRDKKQETTEAEPQVKVAVQKNQTIWEFCDDKQKQLGGPAINTRRYFRLKTTRKRKFGCESRNMETCFTVFCSAKQD